MKNIKIPLIISLVTCCFIIGVLVIGVISVWKMGWFQLPLPEEIPDRRIGMEEDMKESIFKHMSETSQEALIPLVTIGEKGQKDYVWQTIEDLLHRQSEDMEIADYVALLQVVESMTAVDADGTVTMDFEAIGQILQRGYKGAYLTSTMANLCILYKEWVENYILLAPQTCTLFLRRETEEKKAFAEYLEQQMLKAAMLDGILMNDNEIIQSTDRVPQHIPEINIVYYPVEEGRVDHHYLLQIGDKNVKISPLHRKPGHYAVEEVKNNIKSLSLNEMQKENKLKEFIMLQRIVDAYAVAAALSISEDCNIKLVICFKETELEIRARSYGGYMYNEQGDPEYLNVTASDLKTQYPWDNQNPIDQYTMWWESHDGNMSYEKYKRDLRDVLKNNPHFSNKQLEELTPTQISELDKKLKDPNYELNLGDVP